jgi:hypothetical protein
MQLVLNVEAEKGKKRCRRKKRTRKSINAVTHAHLAVKKKKAKI